MKYIKIDPDDRELFEFDIDHLVSDYLVTNLHKFRRMYTDQGNIFWVRYLLTMHEAFLYENFRHYAFSRIVNDGVCFHQCLLAFENALIRIHKCFIEGTYQFAKHFIMDIYKLNQYLVELNPCSSTNIDSVLARNSLKWYYIFGPIRKKSKFSELRIFFQLFFYNAFCNSLCVLLQRYSEASELPQDVRNSYSQKQFFKLIDKLSVDNRPQITKFFIYITKYLAMELPSVLTIPFLKKFVHLPRYKHVCGLDIGDISDHYLISQSLRYKQCDIHKSCKELILHDKDCKNPHFCPARNSCRVICEIESEERSTKLKSNYSKYWKVFEAFTFQSEKPNCRNVSTNAQSIDNSVQTYVIENIRDCIEDRPISPPWFLCPELKNSYNQLRKKEEAAARLREKLGRKQGAAFPVPASLSKAGVYKNYDLRVKLYQKAVKKFTKTPVVNVSKTEFIRSLAALKFLKNSNEFLGEENNLDMKHQVKRSIASGYDGILACNIKKISSLGKSDATPSHCCPKAIHIKTIEKLMKHTCKVSIEEGTLSKSDSKLSGLIQEMVRICYDTTESVDPQNREKHDILTKRALGKDRNDSAEKTESVLIPETEIQSSNDSLVETHIKEYNSALLSVSANFFPPKIDAVLEKLEACENGTEAKDNDVYERYMQMLGIGKQFSNTSMSSIEEKKLPVKKVKKTRQCAFCTKIEGDTKFKKCSQCKTENYPVPRYYCSRECQMEDWREFHRDEHQRNK